MNRMRLIDADTYADKMKIRQDACLRMMERFKSVGSKTPKYTDADVWDRAFGVFCESKLTLDKIPTVDAVPVVRCRDCKYYYKYLLGGWCVVHRHYDLKPDDFCSRGERREEENDGK